MNIFISDSQTLIKSIPADAYGGSIDCISFIDKFGNETASLKKKILHIPSEVINIVCANFGNKISFKIGLQSIVEVYYITEGLQYNEHDAIVELAKILKENNGVFVVTEDKVLMQKIIDLNSPFIQPISPRAAFNFKFQ